MPIFLKGNHQLESRMRESRLSGSEGGAILISRPYPYYARSCYDDIVAATWYPSPLTLHQGS
jgi:hypothetical protein